MKSTPVGIAQVGVGYWGKNLLRNFAALPGVQVLQACDQREGILEGITRQYPGIATTTTVQDILDNPAVDGVVIAAQTPQHFPLASAALKAGKHVFVEKPMAQTRAEAEELVALAAAEDRRLMVGHLLLYHPAFTYVENLIQQGDLGEVYYLYSMRVNLGIIRQQENAFESLAPHDLSIALSFFKERPVGIAAQGQSFIQPNVEDVVFATVYFEGGKIAHLHTSWLDPHKIRKVTVVGSRKMAVIDDVESTEKVRLYDKGVEIRAGKEYYANYSEAMTIRSGDIHIPQINMREPLRMECEHFIDSIRNRTRPRSDGQNGLDVVRLLEAAQLSLKQGGAQISL